MSDPVQGLKGLIESHSKIVIFTGAGISTESGIPDFRSPGGLWTKNQPIDFSDFMASEETRRESWRRKINMDGSFSRSKPNRGHRAVAELHNRGTLRAIVTQNVDNLHEDSGVPADKIIGTKGKCRKCGK